MDIEAQILQKLSDAATIIIHRHQRPDPDAIGSQMGLLHILRAHFPQKTVLATGKTVAGLSWLGVSDEVTDEQFKDSVVVVLDTANRPRIEDDRYTKGKFLIKIDHHPDDDHYGDISWVDPKSSSTSELIVRWATKLNLPIPKEAAAVLYAGIVGDTGRFMYPNTTQQTLTTAAKLVGLGINAADINQHLANITVPVARLSAYVWQHFNVTEHNAAWIVLDHKLLQSFNLGDAGTSSIVPLLGQIATVKCWTIFIQQADGSYRLRIRSKHAAINELAKQYGGGGHPLASGAFMPDATKITAFVAQLDKIAQTDAK